jgi:DNA-binding transcriptional LysR family regulator
MNNWVLDHLEKMSAFEAIVRHGSLLHASQELGVSQPALSRLVANLEEVSGKKLLDRSRLGCKPTPEGKQIVLFFEKLLPMARDLEQKVTVGDEISGLLAVGTFESFATTWWPPFLKNFAKEFPSLKINIRTANGNGHREKLLQGSLDLVVEACPDEHERVTSIQIGSDSFGFYVPKKSLDDENLPLVYVPGAKDDKGKTLLELLRERGVVIGEVFELDSFAAAHEFIAGGLGIGALPERLAAKTSERNTIRRSPKIKGDFGRHSICASFLNENRHDKRTMILVRSLKKYLTA